MTDKQLQKTLDKLSAANMEYKKLLDLAEDEIVRRFGIHPSEIDNDEWIDSYHYGCGHMTVEELNESMRVHIGIRTSFLRKE